MFLVAISKSLMSLSPDLKAAEAESLHITEKRLADRAQVIIITLIVGNVSCQLMIGLRKIVFIAQLRSPVPEIHCIVREPVVMLC